MSRTDVAVVGGGPAGLAAALTLVRSLAKVVVFDDAAPPRNAASRGIRGLPGLDGHLPAALRDDARQEIERYGGATFVGQRVASIEAAEEGGFVVAPEGGDPIHAERVVLACGMRDRFPPIDGLADFWGATAIHCPFCDGIEHRGARWGIVANREGMQDPRIYRTWTEDLVLFASDDLAFDAEQEARLARLGVPLERRAVRRCLGTDARLEAVELEDGTLVERDVLLLWPHQEQTPLVDALSLPLDARGSVVVDAGFRTGRAGVYAAGDLTYVDHQCVATAIHQGTLAAASIVFDRSRG